MQQQQQLLTDDLFSLATPPSQTSTNTFFNNNPNAFAAFPPPQQQQPAFPSVLETTAPRSKPSLSSFAHFSSSSTNRTLTNAMYYFPSKVEEPSANETSGATNISQCSFIHVLACLSRSYVNVHVYTKTEIKLNH